MLKSSALDRIFYRTKLNENTNCVEWQGCVNNKGYGQIRYDKKLYLTHRLVWEENFGQTNLLVLHKCDNRICCNPKHLFLGTAKDNSRDMCCKGRSRKTIVPKEVIDKCIELNSFGMPQSTISILLGISQATVSRCVRGKYSD